MTNPAISVVMSVYNGREYLEASINSILEQSYTDFEFIIVNDGSNDNTKEIIEKCAVKDKRIIAVHQQNIGLAGSLNKGIAMSKGRYIARQDADDVSLQERFATQISFLENNPEIVLCGTWFREINENKGSIIRKYPVNDKTIQQNIKYVNYFCHPSVMFLKDAFLKAGGYDEHFTSAQDFELWIRMAQNGKVANLSEVLVHKRIGFANTISWQNRTQKAEVVRKVVLKHFASWREINIVKFVRYYFPLLIYGYIPVPVLKMFREIRYRGENGYKNK